MERGTDIGFGLLLMTPIQRIGGPGWVLTILRSLEGWAGSELSEAAEGVWWALQAAERKWTKRLAQRLPLQTDTGPTLISHLCLVPNTIWHLSDISRKCLSKDFPGSEVFPNIVDGWLCTVTQGQGTVLTGSEYSQGQSCCSVAMPSPFPCDHSCGLPLGASIHIVSSTHSPHVDSSQCELVLHCFSVSLSRSLDICIR